MDRQFSRPSYSSSYLASFGNLRGFREKDGLLILKEGTF